MIPKKWPTHSSGKTQTKADLPEFLPSPVRPVQKQVQYPSPDKQLNSQNSELCSQNLQEGVWCIYSVREVTRTSKIAQLKLFVLSGVVQN